MKLADIAFRTLQPFGAEIFIDLSKALTKGQIGELVRLFRTHKLLLARGQRLDEGAHRRVMEFFGPVPSDGIDLTSNDAAVGLQGDLKLAFHSDLAFAAEPDLGASLYAIDVADDVSSTSFVNGVDVYRQLPQSLQMKIDRLEALSIWVVDQSRRNRASELKAEDPRTAHPVVWNHPATGEPILYLTEMQTDCILGMEEEESEALIAELFRYLFAPQNILTHVWRKGDLVLWDNLATQHARNNVLLADVGGRTLRRISIARRSFLDQFPQFGPRPEFNGYLDERHDQVRSGAV